MKVINYVLDESVRLCRVGYFDKTRTGNTVVRQYEQLRNKIISGNQKFGSAYLPKGEEIVKKTKAALMSETFYAERNDGGSKLPFGRLEKQIIYKKGKVEKEKFFEYSHEYEICPSV